MCCLFMNFSAYTGARTAAGLRTEEGTLGDASQSGADSRQGPPRAYAPRSGGQQTTGAGLTTAGRERAREERAQGDDRRPRVQRGIRK